MAEAERPRTMKDVVGAAGVARIPTIYTEGVVNLARGPGIVKFYLMRYEPNIHDDGATPALVGQVVAPVIAFATMTLFFQRQLDDMIKSGEISQDAVDQLRRMVPGATGAS
jgi:hypothetical protein